MFNRRKQWIINKKFQYNFLLTAIIPLLILLCFFWLGIEIIFHEMVSFAMDLGLPKNHSFYVFLKDQKLKSLVILILITIPSVFVYFIWAVVYSNKIAGPLYRLNKYFTEIKDLKEDEIPKLSFRKGDYFSEIVDSVNNFLKK